MKRLFLTIIILILLLFPINVFGAENSTIINIPTLDFVWVLISAVLVFFMQAGFAMIEGGFTRAKNVSNIMMKNLMDFAIGSIAYWAIGFGIMFGKDIYGFLGTSKFFLHDVNPSTLEGMKELLYWIFQVMFAATAATIVSGAVAERTKFSAYLIYSIFISSLIYPIVGHWIWGGGWLKKLGMIDFAGSTVVHSVGGWAGLAGTLILGPRFGKYNNINPSKINGKKIVNSIPGHNIPLATLGAFILWMGWFGFNSGSTLSGNNPGIVSIAVNTNLSAAGGAIAAMLYSWLRFKKPDPSMTINGALAGLVSITAGCALVSSRDSIIIGLIAGILVVISVQFFDKWLYIDDPVGAISVHGVCGVFGTIAVGLFAQSGYASATGMGNINGLFYGGGSHLLLIQILGSLSTFGWVFITASALFLFIKATIGLRVSEEEEIMGLDINEHGIEAYSGFQIFISQ